MSVLGMRSRLVRSVLGGCLSLAMVAALAPSAEARPRRPGYSAGYHHGPAPYRRNRGGNGAALAAIAGIAAIGIGAAIASSNRSRSYDSVERDPLYGYAPAYGYRRSPVPEPEYVDGPEVVYEPAPVYAPRPVYQPRVMFAPSPVHRGWDGGQPRGNPGWRPPHRHWNEFRARQEMLDRHTRQ
ncbi:hypothetical protein [Alsobacter metallidurans]|nr:hypothetical protein [Alsobacter metallidurans]